MKDLLALAFHIIPTFDLAEDALDIALTNGISSYDAFYVALSNRIEAPLITADDKLVRSLAGKHYKLRSLSAR
jgi:predicted nucleic acid-binding protein